MKLRIVLYFGMLNAELLIAFPVSNSLTSLLLNFYTVSQALIQEGSVFLFDKSFSLSTEKKYNRRTVKKREIQINLLKREL